MRLPILIIAATLGATVAVSAAAESGRYSTWSNPDASSSPTTADGSGTAGNLVDELRKMVDEAEAAKAADPVFLRDLRGLADRFDSPWRTRLIVDDFVDGDFSKDPAWTVDRGKFWIERGYGLRSTVEAGAAATASESPSGGKIKGKDMAIAILGQLLQQNNPPPAQEDSPAGGSATIAQPAEIHLLATVSNAFSIRLELSSWTKEGRLEWGPYQGAGRAAGYRLVYEPGATPALRLLGVSVGRTRVIESYASALDLEDKKVHALVWTRTAAGDMAVGLDDRTLFRTADRGFREAFDGFLLANHGGDYIVSRVEVLGSE